MTPAEILTWLNVSALVVMAGGFLFMVKVVTNDLKHDVADIKEGTDQTVAGLARIERLLERER